MKNIYKQKLWTVTQHNQEIRLVNKILPILTSANFIFEVWCQHGTVIVKIT